MTTTKAPTLAAKAVKSLAVETTQPRLRDATLRTKPASERNDASSEEMSVRLDVNLSRLARNEVGVRLRATIEGHPAIELSATYEVGVRVDDQRGKAAQSRVDAALKGALNDQVVQLLFPFLRESISSLSTKALGTAIVLPYLGLPEAPPLDLPPYKAPSGARMAVDKSTNKGAKGTGVTKRDRKKK